LAGARGRLAWTAAILLAAAAVWAVTQDDGPHHPNGSTAAPQASARPSLDGTAPPREKAAYDPATYARQVRVYARRAGVDAQLVMAILYNESYKPHDPAFERAWQRQDPNAAFGIANMHRAAFDEVKRGRDFANSRWDELPDDRSLAVEAAAWYLHDLAAQLPAHWTGPYTKDELLALGYNTGGGNMLAFARGVAPGSQARSYLERLHTNWDRAAEALRG
jgi:hypothetical protein